MSARTLIAVNIFLGLLILLTASTATISSGEVGILNVSSSNETQFLTTGDSQSFTSFNGNICELSGSENPLINLLQDFVNVIPLVNCITGFSTYIFSYQAIQTGVVWLGIIIFALVLADLYLVFGLARGGK
jgi:hypothetical protein